MQKYIKVTGIATHDTMIFPAFKVKEVIKAGSSPASTCKVQYMNSDASNDTITITYASTTDLAIDIAMCNFVKDLLVKVQSSSYTSPFLSIAADAFPRTIGHISAPASS